MRTQYRDLGPVTLWRALRDLVSFVAFEAPSEPIELWTAGNAFIWGAWLANPWMTVFAKGFYLGMAFMPESAWGLFAMGVAVMQVYGRIRGQRAFVWFGAVGIAGLWWFAAGSLAVQNWRFATTVMYPAMASASMFVAWRVSPFPRRRAGVPHVDS